MHIEIKALKDIIRNGLPLCKAGMTARMTKALADEVLASGEAELVNPDRKPVDLKKLLERKEIKKSEK